MASHLDDPNAYYWALGKFVHTFSSVELWVLMLLWQYSEVAQLRVAQALFSGVRVKTSMEFVRRIVAAKNETMQPELENTFRQLASIQTARDKIIHFGAWQGDDGRTRISNWRAAHTDKALKEFLISEEILSNMTADLDSIMFRLKYFTEARRVPDRVKYEDYDQFWQKPWLYRPEQPTSRHKESPESNPAQ